MERNILVRCYLVNNGSLILLVTAQGPMVSQMQLANVKRQVDDAVAHGAKKLHESAVPAAGGNYYPITVLSDLTQDMLIQRAETFGPVVALSAFDGTEATAIALANDTEYGLCSYVYTGDLARGARVAKKFRSGQVGINCYSIAVSLLLLARACATATLPFPSSCLNTTPFAGRAAGVSLDWSQGFRLRDALGHGRVPLLFG